MPEDSFWLTTSAVIVLACIGSTARNTMNQRLLKTKKKWWEKLKWKALKDRFPLFPRIQLKVEKNMILLIQEVKGSTKSTDILWILRLEERSIQPLLTLTSSLVLHNLCQFQSKERKSLMKLYWLTTTFMEIRSMRKDINSSMRNMVLNFMTTNFQECQL